ncbi:MAG: hypothetical protein R3F60_31925 [bacterium]
MTVYDFGHIPKETERASQGRYPAGRPFLVMELVEGGSWRPAAATCSGRSCMSSSWGCWMLWDTPTPVS